MPDPALTFLPDPLVGLSSLIYHLGTALLVLLIGDFSATFGYHVPQHVFGRYHRLVHHSPHRSFVRYAIARRRPWALLHGLAGVLPYLWATPGLWQLSPWGVGLGLLLGEVHVLWRHAPERGYQTPLWLARLCQCCGITTPERHWSHHTQGNGAFGDVFAFYGRPAQGWFQFLSQRRSRLAPFFLGNRG